MKDLVIGALALAAGVLAEKKLGLCGKAIKLVKDYKEVERFVNPHKV